MADQTVSQSSLRRSAVYSYLRPIVEGRRVLEVGCGSGDTAALLVRLGAKSVIGAGSSRDVSEARAHHHEGALGFVTMGNGAIDASGVFDLVVVPDATDVLRGHGAVKLSVLLALVGPSGQLACVVGNGDVGEGLPYYDIVDALSPHFSKVRMFGQTPFSAYGIAEFDEAAADLRVESELADAEAEEPTHYIALAGPDEPHALGYALVQIPTASGEGAAPVERPAVGGAHKAPDTLLAEIRLKLVETEGKAEGLLRVSRAQSEEIEELRARLRRTAEARADLDEEVRRLRNALLEADESVVNLTRKTTEEMTALAQRLTSGLRAGDATPGPVPTVELERRERELAERESALTERDDRIAALEVSRQEAAWRADAAEDELDRMRVDLATLRAERDRALADAERARELEASLKAQAATIEEFRRAAAAHVDEVNRLHDAANEQASLVSELEEQMRATEARLEAATAEVEQLRKALAESEDADRARRSRLAELEGLMLRAEREAGQQNERRQRELAEMEELRARAAAGAKDAAEQRRLEAALAEVEAGRQTAAARVAELEGLMLRAEREAGEQNERRRRELAEMEELRARAAAGAKDAAEQRRLEAALAEAEAARQTAEARVAELEQQLRVGQERDRRLAELRAEAPDPEEVYERLFDLETQYQAATMAAARVPDLEARLAELEARLAGK